MTKKEGEEIVVETEDNDKRALNEENKVLEENEREERLFDKEAEVLEKDDEEERVFEEETKVWKQDDEEERVFEEEMEVLRQDEEEERLFEEEMEVWKDNTLTMINILTEYLLPYLARRRKIDLLIAYRHELNMIKSTSDGDFLSDLSWIEKRLLITLIDWLPLAEIEEVMGTEWRKIDINVARTLLPRYKDTFLEICRMTQYELDIGGYLCMEPEEWIEWYTHLPPDVDRRKSMD